MSDMEKGASARLSAADVWLSRGEAVARAAVGAVRWIHRRLRGALADFARARARRIALRQLYQMDDRLLADIGLRREQVPEFVDGMFRRRSVAAVTRPTRLAEVESVEPVTGVEAGNDRTFRPAA